MKKWLFFPVAVAFFFSCSDDASDAAHPGAKLIGTYDVSCTCDNITPGGAQGFNKTYEMEIVKIDGDSTRLEILNLDDAATSTLVKIITANSIEDGEFSGNLYQNTLTISYVRYPNHCNGTAVKK